MLRFNLVRELVQVVPLSIDTFFCVFQENVFLRILDLSFNGFGKEGASALGQALKENNVLEELNIRYVSLLCYYRMIRLVSRNWELKPRSFSQIRIHNLIFHIVYKLPGEFKLLFQTDSNRSKMVITLFLKERNQIIQFPLPFA